MTQSQTESSSSVHSTTRLVRTDPRRLGEIIVQYTTISPDDVQAALGRCRESGLLLGEQLIRDGKLTPDDRARCLAIQWGIPYCDLAKAHISPDAIQLLDPDYQRERKIMPLKRRNGVLYLGLVDPLKVTVVDDVRLLTGCDIRPVLVSESALDARFVEFFGEAPPVLEEAPPAEAEEKPSAREISPEELETIVDDIKTELHLETEGVSEAVGDVHELRASVDDAAVIRLVNTVITQGIMQGASDIHFQGERDRMQVRYRVDGLLHDGPKVPLSLMKVVVARLKVMARLDLAFKRTPQDGRLSAQIGGRKFEVRVSILPAIKGSKVVMRVAEQGNELIGLDRLGFSPPVLEQLRSMILRPYGMILVTGPTGSGKSTTLYSAIKELNQTDTNILTVEDPVESQIDNITQVEVSDRSGLSFAASLRAALRQDPDIIMVGEIRDGESAGIATQASLTGHLVLSTLHTNDAASAVTRLVDMGIQPFLVGSSLIGVLAQRLARKVCKECAQDFVPSPREIENLTIKAPEGGTLMLKKPKGCPTCRNSGYKGRLGIFELLSVSESVRMLILERQPDSIIRKKAIEEGMATLVDDASAKVMAGLTTLEEANRVVFF